MENNKQCSYLSVSDWGIRYRTRKQIILNRIMRELTLTAHSEAGISETVH